VHHRHCKYRFIVIARRRQYAIPPNTWFRRPSGAARGEAGGTPPPRNWVHKEIGGCAVEQNTQNCAWFGSQIHLITAMNFREAMPPEPPTRGSAPGPRWGTSVPQTPCAPTSKSWLRHCVRHTPAHCYENIHTSGCYSRRGRRRRKRPDQNTDISRVPTTRSTPPPTTTLHSPPA